jgi:hypothetical protein
MRTPSQSIASRASTRRKPALSDDRVLSCALRQLTMDAETQALQERLRSKYAGLVASNHQQEMMSTSVVCPAASRSPVQATLGDMPRGR